MLYPFEKGGEAPAITISDGTVRVTLGDEEDVLVFDRSTGVSIRRGEVNTKLTTKE